ncbi:TIGR00725 family protein [Streptomyces sp. B6B3]|uniref:TIGR00725 family protein n=1 Tax=Streptomyces sp. B6B3 TaxID=3153570 RepID=UPI00325D97E9
MKEHQQHPATAQVAVCGPRDCTPAEYAVARRVGQLLAERGAVVLCGGGTGVMAAVTEGARAAGGLVIGIRPNATRAGAHPDLSAVVLTDLGEARNAVLVTSADAVIAVGGSWGTLSELAFACRRGDIPVLSLVGWKVLTPTGDPAPGITDVPTPEEAVTLALDPGTWHARPASGQK